MLKHSRFLFSQFPYAVADCRGAKEPAEGIALFEPFNLFLNIQDTNFPRWTLTGRLYIKKLKTPSDFKRNSVQISDRGGGTDGI